MIVKSLKVGIVQFYIYTQFYRNEMSMIIRDLMTQIRWLVIALLFSLVLVSCFEGAVFETS
jgi:hypothetical protein